MCRDYVEERRDIIRAIVKGRKLSDLPKISQVRFLLHSNLDAFFTFSLDSYAERTFISLFLSLLKQPTLIVWGENDQIFPLELAHRLKRLIS